MPLNVRRVYTSVLLILVSFIAASEAQTVLPAPSPTPQSTEPQTIQPPVRTPTAGEIMRDRITKSKAFIAVRNFNAAIYELENIRRESNDASVQAVVDVLLMNSYLGQADYKRAQAFLTGAFNEQKTTKANATANYFAIASQVVKSARNNVERYRALGLNVSDRTLPLEAVNDLEKMRETLEMVVTQSKEVSKDKTKTADAMALLEEAASSRSMMARDEYDARHWKDEVSDTREQMTSARSVVINAVNDGMPDTLVNQNSQVLVANNSSGTQNPATNPNSAATANIKLFPADLKSTSNDPNNLIQKTVSQSPIFTPGPQKNDEKIAGLPPVPAGTTPSNTDPVNNKTDTPKTLVISNPQPKAGDNVQKPNSPATTSSAATDPVKGAGPMEVGSLIPYATKQTPPTYPPAAKSIRATGVVRVEVTVDENGDVADVQKTSGPPLLQGAAKDAIRKWRFRPFVRDGLPVKATGFVNFNFSL